MEPSERTWGISPVPDRLRTLSGVDVGLLWGNLGISLLVLFTGTFLAGLGLQRALLATLVGAVLGVALLGLAGLIGFDRRVPAMVLLRDPLGVRGSYAPTALNVAQNIGWAVFELYVMSLAAAALSEEVFGFEARWLWVLLFAALTAWLALAGPDLLRAPLGAPLRGVGRGGLDGVSRLVGARRRRRGRPLVGGRRRRAPLLPGRRPDRRDGGLMASARGRLHALLSQQAGGVLGDVGRVSRAPRPPLRARRFARALARARRPGGDLHGDRSGRGRQRGRAARAHGGRGRRALRQRLLDGRLDPEPPARRLAARCSSSA